MTVAHAIPTIDISPYLKPDSDEEAKQTVIKEVKNACSTYGFLQVKGHGVPIESQGAMLRCCKALFDLPIKDKEALSLKNNPARRSAECNTPSPTASTLTESKRLRKTRRPNPRLQRPPGLQRSISTPFTLPKPPHVPDNNTRASTSAARSPQSRPASSAALTNGLPKPPYQLKCSTRP